MSANRVMGTEEASQSQVGDSSSYAAYESVEIPWLNVVPVTWSTAKLRFVTRVNPPKSYLDASLEDDQPVSFVPMEAVGERGGLELCHERRLSNVRDQYTYFENGDVLVAKITPSFENGKGALAEDLKSGVGLGTTELHVLRPGPRVDARFLFYLTQSHHFRRVGEHAMYGAGGQKRIPAEFVEQFQHPIPPLDDQQIIASFLDRHTSGIDSLIDRKKCLIELLEEKRTALMTRVVTKGLDSGGPLKETEVGWLGEIPEHWAVSKVKHVARMESGHTPNRETAEYWNGEIQWLSLADSKLLKKVDVVEETSHQITKAGLANSSARLLPQNTVAFSRDATVGLCALLGHEMAVSQHFIGWVCSERILPRYLLLVLRCMKQELERLTMGATIRTLGLPEVSSLVTPLPPRREQFQIVRQVSAAEGEISALKNRVVQAVSLLMEYRTALISAAVTGKIDVSGHAA